MHLKPQTLSPKTPEPLNTVPLILKDGAGSGLQGLQQSQERLSWTTLEHPLLLQVV